MLDIETLADLKADWSKAKGAREDAWDRCCEIARKIGELQEVAKLAEAAHLDAVLHECEISKRIDALEDAPQ